LGWGVVGTVSGCGVARFLRLARTAVLLALFATSLLVMAASASADECPNEALRKEQGSKLSDCRAYELVSPVNKNGGSVIGDTTRTRAAAGESASSPMAATFSSLENFSDVRGGGAATDYLSVRTGRAGTSGWETHATIPPQEPLTLIGAFTGGEPLYIGDLSADLSRGVLKAWSPVTNDPKVKDVRNLYVREDLREPGRSSNYQLLTPCPACASPLPPFAAFQVPALAGASADFDHVIFESALALTPDATGSTNLYEWDHGTLRLAGVLPDVACGSPVCAAASSIAGTGASFSHYTAHTISADGSRIIFTDNSSTGDGSGVLYMRIDHTTTQQINASEKSIPDAPQPATFQAASADGKRVFFITAEQLTSDDQNNVPDLYMYDSDGSPGARLTRLSTSDIPGNFGNVVKGVVGASDDGHYVYFIATGQLIAGKPDLALNHGLYLWHDGQLAYVGELAEDQLDELRDLSSNWGLFPSNVRVTPDGRHVLFAAHSGVGLLSAHGGVDYDQGVNNCQIGHGCTEFYVYSADTNALACATCDMRLAAATADAMIAARVDNGGATTTFHTNRAISDDGRFVFFSTAEALVPGDTNGKIDAYEYDVATKKQYLLSSGTSTTDSYFMDASGTGDDAFFVTRERLVGWDGDSSADLYDARVRGGFPEPSQAPPCVGDACHGATSAPPSEVSPASSTSVGGGNVRGIVTKSKPKPLHCKRGYVKQRVKGKVKCVKRPKRHPARHTRTRRGH
jgi:hypothetical protein